MHSSQHIPSIPITLTIILVISSFVTLAIYSNFPELPLSINSHIYGQYLTWKTEHNKNYQPDQDILRYSIFKSNYLMVQQHNRKAQSGQQSYWMAINKFSDMTEQQFANLYLIHSSVSDQMNLGSYTCNSTQPPERDLPDAFDWSARSIVTPVREAGPCSASSYAVATIQSIQSSRSLSTGRLIELSAQQLLDCSAEFGNQGCIKGNATASFGYIKKFGIASQKKYPFKGFSADCKYTISMKQTQILGCVQVTPHKQISIKNAVFRQPLVVSINAAKIKSYSKGVFDTNNILYNQCKTDPNHWLLLVGYGRDEQAKKNYWKLKNSWGIQWGMQGYLYIVRKGDGQGQCGVQSQLYYPIA